MANGMFAGGAGIVTNPYLIEDAADLDAIRRNTAAHYKLINNINLGAPPYSIGKGFEPIPMFSGTFNGNGKKIVNLYINRPDTDKVGLFSEISIAKGHRGAMFYDFALENISISGRNYVGGVLGYAFTLGIDVNDMPDAKVCRATVAGRIEAIQYLGGVIGWFGGDYTWTATINWLICSDVISKCDLLIKAPGTVRYMGGITGGGSIYSRYNGNYGYANLLRCVSICTFSTIDGGKNGAALSGYNLGTATDCFCDSILASGNLVTGSISLTTQEFYDLSNKLDNLKGEHNSGNGTVWRFKAGHYPQLWFSNQGCYFIRIGNDYLTYDVPQKEWIKQFDLLPSTPAILTKGMPTVSTLDTNAWNQLKQHGAVDIINFLESVEKLFVSNAKIDLMLETSQADASMISFRKEINFADFNNDIVTVVP